MNSDGHPAAPARDDPPPAGPAPRERAATAARILSTAELAVGCVLVATVLVLVVTQAAQRYLPVQGSVWTGELARYALVWLTFALAGHLTARGEHIGLEVVDYVARGRTLTVIRRLADAVVAATAVAFTIDAWNLVGTSAGRVSPAIGIPLNWVYVVPLVGFALTALSAGWAAVAGRPAEDAEPAAPVESAAGDTEPAAPVEPAGERNSE